MSMERAVKCFTGLWGEMRILAGKLASSHRKSSQGGELLVCLWERHLSDRHLVEINQSRNTQSSTDNPSAP